MSHQGTSCSTAASATSGPSCNLFIRNEEARVQLRIEKDPYTGFENFGDGESPTAASTTSVASCNLFIKSDEPRVQLWIENDPYTGFEDLGDLESPTEEEREQEEEEEGEEKEGLDDIIEAVKIENNARPYVGKEFHSADEAYNFYNMYANHVGFSIRRNTQSKSRSGLSSVRFVCSKEGFNTRQKHDLKILDKKGSTNQKSCVKERGTTRTGCKACIRVRRVKGGIWQVSVYSDDHNHELTPNALPKKRKRNLRSQKNLIGREKGIIRELSAQKMGRSQPVEHLVVKSRGKNSTCSKKKVASSQVAGENIIFIGVATTLLYFQKKQEEDPEFFYAIEPDEDGLVKHVFWVDGRSRRAYLEFGDVVTFDTSYCTGNNSMPLAPFLGVNHHQHLIFFGMAFLRPESKNNLCWLFKTWLKAMYEKHPTAIIINQDPAIIDAIKITFPKTVHRCCQLHVMRKARQHLISHYDKRPGLEEELEAVINHNMKVSDFEKTWADMLHNYDLTSNSHLLDIYEKRAEWIPAYFRDAFFAEMSTSQRSKSMNLLLELWMSSHNSFYRFVRNFESILDNIWQREDDEDIKTMNKSSSLWSTYLIEVDARRVYTTNVFLIFQGLLKEVSLGVVIEKERDALYEVSITSHPSIPNWTPISYLIEVDKASERFSCNCKGFEFEGLLCSHALKAMCHFGIQHLPSRYILRRWCKEANANIKRSVHERAMDLGESTEALKAFRSASIKLKLSELAELACKSADAFRMVMAMISEMKAEVMRLSQITD